MWHIYKAEEEKFHDLSESTTCDCGPEVRFDNDSGEMFVIHDTRSGKLDEQYIENAIAIARESDPEGVF